MKLLTRPRPVCGESAPGYLLRLATANGYPNPTWLTRAFDARFPAAVFVPTTADLIAQLVGISRDQAKQALYLPADEDAVLGLDTEHNVCGSIVKRRFIRVGPARVCMPCLQAKSFVPAAWDLSIFQVCPDHSQPMQRACPKCATPLTYHRRDLWTCTCGASLVDIATDQDPVTPNVAGLARILSDKAGGYVEGCNTVDHGFPRQLMHLTLQETLNLIFLVGISNYGITWSTGQKLAAEGTEKKLFNTLCNAANVLADWPKHFHHLLKHGACADGNPTSLFKSLGPAYETLFKNTRHTSLDFVWEEVEAYVENVWVGHYTRKHTRISETTATHIPASQAAEMLGISETSVGALMETGELDGSVERAGTRSYRVVSIDSAHDYASKARDHLGLSDAAHTLGLRKDIIKKLANDGLIHCYQKPDRTGFRYWILSRESIENLLTAFSEATKREFPAYFQALSFQSICGIAGRYGKRLSDILRAVSAGEVGPRLEDRDAKGVQAYSFSQEEIFDWLNRDRKAVLKDYLDADSVALALATKRQVVYEWISRGFIGSINIQRRQLVCAEQIEKFHNEYVVAARVASAFGTSSNLLLKVLGDYGVWPCSGPTVDHGRQYLLRRNELNSIDMRKVRIALKTRTARKR
jgi:ribosomal protein L37AE/L43A